MQKYISKIELNATLYQLIMTNQLIFHNKAIKNHWAG